MSPDADQVRRRARNELVEAHLSLVDHCVRRYANRGVPSEDLRQIAFLAMVEAADRFDPSREVKFATFASRTIDGTLKRHFRDRTWTVRPPRELQELYLKLRKANEELGHELGREPSLHELADRLDVDIDKIHQILEAGNTRCATSIDAPAPHDHDAESFEPAWLGDLDEQLDQAEIRILLEELLDQLDDTSREILRLRFAEDRSQSEIGDQIGVSQSCLSRKVRGLLSDMRRDLGELESV
jgi:RNA polymerase sigma-B factor